MKPILSLVLIIALTGCFPQRELQADLVDVTLVKVDTTHRFPDSDKKILTWMTSNKLTIVTFEPAEAYYPVGTRMKMMIPR
ncbi:MAG: hypothetical protein ACO1OO_07290 [Flavisolibacter sp.]